MRGCLPMCSHPGSAHEQPASVGVWSGRTGQPGRAVGPSSAHIGEDLEAFIAAAPGNQPRNRGIATPRKEKLVDMGNPNLSAIPTELPALVRRGTSGKRGLAKASAVGRKQPI